MSTIVEALTMALQQYQAGDLQRAESLCRQVLQADPRQAVALNFLGVIAHQAGRHDIAVDYMKQSLLLAPGNEGFHSNLGISQHALGKFDEAAASFREALRLNPAFAEAHYNLGLALQAQEKLADAEACLRQALRLRPDYAEAHFQLGFVLGKLGRHEEAVASNQQALRLRPDHAEAHVNLGVAFKNQGKLDESVLCFQQAVRLKPDYGEAHYNLGWVSMRHGRLDLALTSFRQALRLKPNMADAHMNLGHALRALSEFDEAVDCYQQALRIRPNFAEAHNSLGETFMKQGQLDRALACFQKALQSQPESAAFHSNVLFCLSHDPQADPDAVFAEHCRFGQLCQPAMLPPPHPNDPDPERRLRIGYVSPDLCRYGLTRYVEPVLAHHDGQLVEIFCYADVRDPDAVTARLQNLVQGWRSTWRLSDDQLADRIRRDRIDILVDLTGHQKSNRLPAFAHKPAPVQVTWLGYLNTTGLTTIDYRLTDDMLDPPGEPVRDTEELMRLPGGMFCFAPPLDAPDVAPLPALRLGHLTFGSLHGLVKLNPRVFDLWSEVLRALPRARLLLFHDTLVGEAQERIRRQFSDRGIAGGRLDLRQGSCAPGYLGVYEEIDVSFDTFPWSGGVTTCEALWMGVPVLSLWGGRPASRNSAAILSRVGLADWAVATPEEYVGKAIYWAKNLAQLAELRTGMRDRMVANLCSGQRFTHVLEDAYRTMWRRWCERQITSAGGRRIV
jgi:protein O-GlcNAc transferase